MENIALIFRKKSERFFSIEKVFESINANLSEVFSIRNIHAPFYTKGLMAVWKNIQYISLNSRGSDLYHVTGDIHYVVLGLPKKRTILTIHDLGFMKQFTGLKKIFFHWLYIRMPIRRSAIIVTISEKTKQEILSYTNCPPEKIKVIPNPVNSTIYYSDLSFNQANPNILFIGTTENKNLLRTAEALKGITCRLTIVGALNADQKEELLNNGINFKSLTGLSDIEIAQEYSKADMVLFPSLYEGFGMPVIEGQKAGRPVISSNISPIKDIAGEGAFLVDPNDVNSIRNAILTVIADEGLRRILIQEGLRNVKKYSPLNISKMYVDVYRSVLNSN